MGKMNFSYENIFNEFYDSAKVNAITIDGVIENSTNAKDHASFVGRFFNKKEKKTVLDNEVKTTSAFATKQDLLGSINAIESRGVDGFLYATWRDSLQNGLAVVKQDAEIGSNEIHLTTESKKFLDGISHGVTINISNYKPLRVKSYNSQTGVITLDENLTKKVTKGTSVRRGAYNGPAICNSDVTFKNEYGFVTGTAARSYFREVKATLTFNLEDLGRKYKENLSKADLLAYSYNNIGNVLLYEISRAILFDENTIKTVDSGTQISETMGILSSIDKTQKELGNSKFLYMDYDKIVKEQIEANAGTPEWKENNVGTPELRKIYETRMFVNAMKRIVQTNRFQNQKILFLCNAKMRDSAFTIQTYFPKAFQSAIEIHMSVSEAYENYTNFFKGTIVDLGGFQIEFLYIPELDYIFSGSAGITIPENDVAIFPSETNDFFSKDNNLPSKEYQMLKEKYEKVYPVKDIPNVMVNRKTPTYEGTPCYDLVFTFRFAFVMRGLTSGAYTVHTNLFSFMDSVNEAQFHTGSIFA